MPYTPEQREHRKKFYRSRNQALQRLRDAHREEYDLFLAEEQARLGLHVDRSRGYRVPERYKD